MKKLLNKERLSTFIKAGVITLVLFSGALVAWGATLSVPSLQSFDERKVFQSTKIYDRTGEVVLFDFNRDVRRTVIPLEDMSENIIEATLAIEDDEFYSHHGVRPLSFLRAAYVNLQEGSFSQGGSTITQQVVKNSLLTGEKKVSRKVKEWILAIRLENEISKDEILEIYLNEIPYGGTVYGIEEASLYFYGKRASELTVAESAYLAGLPKAPTYYSPHGNNLEALEARKNLVLDQMYENDFITEAEYEEARAAEVAFLSPEERSIQAPHFVFFIREYLEEEYGARVVEERGLRVITTLDYELQREAEEIVKKHALENETRFNAENASLVAIDPKTGQIITMVGSRDYFDEGIDGKFNIAVSRRQPGSAFKPFTYATAFDKGYTPETILFDLKTQFSTTCGPQNFSSEYPCYSPGNYDDTFRGPMTMRDALAQSVNIPAVKAFYLAGPRNVIRTAERMGITGLEDVGTGLSLALGAGEVSLLDITSAYGVFANDGVRNEHTGILRIEDNQGVIIEEYEQDEEEVLSKQVARQMNDVLSDNTARAPAFGSNSLLSFPGREVAAKTGTTNDYRDAWIVGYTPTLSVGAWAGNNDNSSMVKRVAGFIIAPLWNEFFEIAMEKYPPERFREPQIDYDELKPMLRGQWRVGASSVLTPRSDDENSTSTPSQYLAGGSAHSILHWVEKDNPRGPIPSNPSRDPQYALWEYPVRMWVGGTIYTPSNNDGTAGENNDDNDEDNNNRNGNRPSSVNDVSDDEIDDILERTEELLREND